MPLKRAASAHPQGVEASLGGSARLAVSPSTASVPINGTALGTSQVATTGALAACNLVTGAPLQGALARNTTRHPACVHVSEVVADELTPLLDDGATSTAGRPSDDGNGTSERMQHFLSLFCAAVCSLRYLVLNFLASDGEWHVPWRHHNETLHSPNFTASRAADIPSNY